MQTNDFSIKDAIYAGFTKTINNFGLFVVTQILHWGFFILCGYALIYAVYGTLNVNAIPQGEAAAEYARNLPHYKGYLALSILLLMYIIHRIFVLGTTNISLTLVAQRQAHISEIISKWYLIGWDLIIRIGLLGLILVAIVGTNVIIDKLNLPIKFYPFQLGFGIAIILYIALRCGFSRTILVERECSAYAALAQSYQLTRGHSVHLMRFWFVVGLTKLINLVPFGSLITLPVACISQIQAFKALSAQPR